MGSCGDVNIGRVFLNDDGVPGGAVVDDFDNRQAWVTFVGHVERAHRLVAAGFGTRRRQGKAAPRG